MCVFDVSQITWTVPNELHLWCIFSVGAEMFSPKFGRKTSRWAKYWSILILFNLRAATIATFLAAVLVGFYIGPQPVPVSLHSLSIMALKKGVLLYHPECLTIKKRLHQRILAGIS